MLNIVVKLVPRLELVLDKVKNIVIPFSQSMSLVLFVGVAVRQHIVLPKVHGWDECLGFNRTLLLRLPVSHLDAS